MEYKRLCDTGVFEIWKEGRLLGHSLSVDELWKRRVYVSIGGGIREKSYEGVNEREYDKKRKLV